MVKLLHRIPRRYGLSFRGPLQVSNTRKNSSGALRSQSRSSPYYYRRQGSNFTQGFLSLSPNQLAIPSTSFNYSNKFLVYFSLLVRRLENTVFHPHLSTALAYLQPSTSVQHGHPTSCDQLCKAIPYIASPTSDSGPTAQREGGLPPR